MPRIYRHTDSLHLKTNYDGVEVNLSVVVCDIQLQPVQLLGYLDFPHETNRNEAEGESILCMASENGKQNDKVYVAGWAESIFRMLQKVHRCLANS